MILESLRKLLEPTLEVVATVTDGRALLEAASRLRPDLVITDISMPEIDGVDGVAATRRLGTLSPTTRVLVLSFHDEPSWVRAAFDAGAWGYLSKTSALDEIEVAVREVLGGRFYVSPAVTRALVLPLHKVAGPPIPELPESEKELTPRERDVVRLVGQGLSNKEIADQLGVSVSTVRTHLSSAYDKLGRGNRVELALYAVQTSENAS
jgi:DNA-binding NarL/FixJ family response regulator